MVNLVQSSDELNHDKCQLRVAFLEEHTRELQAGLKDLKSQHLSQKLSSIIK